MLQRASELRFEQLTAMALFFITFVLLSAGIVPKLQRSSYSPIVHRVSASKIK